MRKRRTTVTRVLLVGAVAGVTAAGLLPGPAMAEAELAPLHRVTADVIEGSYIVVYKDGTARAARDRLESAVAPEHGKVDLRYDGGLPGFSAVLDHAGLDQVRRDPIVAYVATDSRLHVDAQAGSWGVDRINQRSLPLDGLYWSNTGGTGVHAYVIDSGVRDTHVQFGGRASRDVNFNADGRNDDCLWHGTHVAGTVAGATVGAARSVRVHGVRVFDCIGSTTTSAVIAAVNWVINNGQRPAVINMSLGGPVNQALDNAVNTAIDRGISVVVSAGNSGVDACTQSPARVPRAITVANSNRNDARHAGPSLPSNFGSCVDLFAPGTDIVSATNLNDTGTVSATGTSMSAPHVTGAAALYLNKHSTATPQQVRDAIVGRATQNVITDVRGSPNRLLYTTFDADGDYNGDGTTDVAVWRPGDGFWHVRAIGSAQWGVAGDVPVPGDYNGDGTTDLAIWRPSTGQWWVANQFVVQWGQAGDIPVPADYNRDGITDLAVWRPSDGMWHVRNLWSVQWGVAGDVPVPADYNGDGFAEVAVFRPADGFWHVRLFWSVQWGQRGDIPVPADYNGDGIAEVAVFRPADGFWHVRLFWSVQWGQWGDVPVTGDFNGDALTDVAVWRPSDGVWHVRLFWSVQWGQRGDIPVS